MTDAKAALAGGASGLPDAIRGQTLFRLTPAAWHPYLQLARLDRPIGWWLLLLPCWWSSALASVAAGRAPNLAQLALFMIGAIVMRGAGSTYNDIVDREIDAKVERTRGRPIASGRIGVKAARVFLVVQAVIGLAVVLCFNRATLVLGVCSLGIVALYPFMKRVTSWPQLVLGFAFAWGGLLGWTAELGSLAAAPVLLYAGGVVWTVGYDTIYAIQDVRDDPAAGVKSTARLFGTHVKLAVGLLYLTAACLIEAAVCAAGAATNVVAQAGVVGFLIHCGWQVSRIERDDPSLALALFRSNRNAGLLVFAAFAAAAWVSVASR